MNNESFQRNTMNPMRKERLMLFGGIIGGATLAALLILFVFNNKGGEAPVQAAALNEVQLSEKQQAKLIDAIGELIVDTSEEDPIIAEITDPEALRAEQAFYQDAQAGDYIVLYPDLQRAVIYNPREDILVNVGPIHIDPTAELGVPTEPLDAPPAPAGETLPEEVAEEITEETEEASEVSMEELTEETDTEQSAESSE